MVMTNVRHLESSPFGESSDFGFAPRETPVIICIILQHEKKLVELQAVLSDVSFCVGKVPVVSDETS